MLSRRLVPIHLIAILIGVPAIACRSNRTTEPLPPDALIGSWGGGTTELVADSREVRLRSGCRSVRFPQLLVKGPLGHVHLAPAPVLTYGGTPSELATVEGQVRGDTLQLDVRIGGPYGASLEQVELVRGRSVDFSHVLCAV